MIARRQFAGEASAVGAARSFAAAALGDQRPDLVDKVSLMVSELATNAIQHAGVGFSTSIEVTPAVVRVEVADAGSGAPVLRAPGITDSSGRGLRIVDQLASAWGVVADRDGGKHVWFDVRLPHQAAKTRGPGKPKAPAVERTDPLGGCP